MNEVEPCRNIETADSEKVMTTWEMMQARLALCPVRPIPEDSLASWSTSQSFRLRTLFPIVAMSAQEGTRIE